MKVAILGTGYVGLVSGVCLAARNHDVTCIDLDSGIVDRINRGDSPIYELGLPELLTKVLREGRFRARVAGPDAFAGQTLILICVGTPSKDGRIDLTYVGEATRDVAAYVAAASDTVSVVVKSTVLPGTTDTFVRDIIDAAIPAGTTYGLGMNPEFLREGEAVSDFLDADRIVLGYEDQLTLDRLRELYAPWECEKLEVNSRSAEMIKYVNNCLLATQISSINELANVAAAIGGINIRSVLEGVHSDRRWNPIAADGKRANPGILRYLIPGSGFGGSCFPKDVQAFVTFGHSLDLGMQLMQAVLDVNERQAEQAVKLLEGSLGDLAGKRLLVLGMAFKSGTDDVRESPAIRLIQELAARGANVYAHDPMAAQISTAQLPASVEIVSDWKSEIAASDAVVIATAWPEYKALCETAQSEALGDKVLVDTRFMLRQSDLPNVQYRSIGDTGVSRPRAACKN
jgi:UDPglucose 6-dehydrogenase/GDP-mannose 6-dehydrogenase